MVVTSLRSYWILVSADRRGDSKAKKALELMAHGRSKEALLAQKYLQTQAA